MVTWLAAYWYEILQSAGIVGLFVFNMVGLKEQAAARRLSNQFALTQQHREIWKEYLRRPDLHRIKEQAVDLERAPITPAEETFVKFIIVHLVSAYRASQLGETEELGAIGADVRKFFSLPIPAAVWERCKGVQADDFVTFFEKSRNGAPHK